jgi:hypothetical protein
MISLANELDIKSQEIEALPESLNTRCKEVETLKVETLKVGVSNCKMSLQAAKNQILRMVPGQELMCSVAEAASIKKELVLSCEAQSRLSSRTADLEVECRLLKTDNEKLHTRIEVSPMKPAYSINKKFNLYVAGAGLYSICNFR